MSKKENSKDKPPAPTGPVDYVQGFAAPLDQITFPDAAMPTEVLLEPLEAEEVRNRPKK